MATATARAGSDLDPQDEEELLLIVSGMGEHIVAENRYMIGQECKDCVADLQRYLRRDDPMVMAAHRALGSWRVLQTHLIPLLQATGDSDVKLAFNVLKVIVKLTMKPEQLGARRTPERGRRAARGRRAPRRAALRRAPPQIAGRALHRS